ncbi:heavy-metal-associated domain-containing protein [Prosthecobacter vanneervenii]|uniref:Copper chaperone CopZ n=1 Tax=Prosthecobacter vanneervenii TaxID=48466 RepID=A0A7W8DJR8_9BACT|nr:heavy-metal-associated domain-containing protein [Prosthecobacter vanneervenii]MBB5032300.1 copper chaperone CopZ [Prosthecobacter vanneervenii]
MRSLLSFFLLLSALEAAEPVTRTFYVSGMECGSCVYMVQQSITETKGVTDVNVAQILDSYANVTFDPAVVTEQQIAQAVREAYPLHGTPYLATLKLSVTDYSKNEAKVESLFAEWKKCLKLEVVDRASGSLVVHFLPIELDKKKPSPQGWSVAQWMQAAQKHGLKFKLEQEG